MRNGVRLRPKGCHDAEGPSIALAKDKFAQRSHNRMSLRSIDRTARFRTRNAAAYVDPANTGLRAIRTTQAIMAGSDTQTPVIEFRVGEADDVAVAPMVINEMQGLVTRHLRCSQPEERLMRIGPMGITRQKIVPGQQGLIVPLPEPTYVPKLLGISDHNDGFRAVEKW